MHAWNRSYVNYYLIHFKEKIGCDSETVTKFWEEEHLDYNEYAHEVFGNSTWPEINFCFSL